jgi:hypothetical protein
MNRSGVLGFLCACALIAVPVVWVDRSLTSDIDKGEVACKAQIVQAKITHYVMNDLVPECASKVAEKLLLGYTFAAAESKPKQGDPLTCRVTEHNAWYFSWDIGWFNDQSYSYDFCKVAKPA